jgi:hypothetical protein
MATAASKAVSAEVAASLAIVRQPSLGLLLYGSHARGDQASTSDVDLLQLVTEPHKSYSEGAVSVVAYTIDQLRSMARAGSLFAWHLRTEGIILEDSDRQLEDALAEHPGPATDRVLIRLRELSAILDVSRDDLDRYGARLSRLAKYLLRTAIYARSLETDEASFALDLAVKAAQAESILPLLVRNASGAEPPPLIEYRDALVKVLGAPLTPNLFGSLEALVVNRWETDRQLAVMAVHAMSDNSGELDYELMTFSEL